MVGTASRKPQILKLMLNPQPHFARRPTIQAWLYAVAALMVLTLVVGGATRLTESGLSIVEWKPVTGVLPPLTEPQRQVSSMTAMDSTEKPAALSRPEEVLRNG